MIHQNNQNENTRNEFSSANKSYLITLNTERMAINAEKTICYQNQKHQSGLFKMLLMQAS